MWFVEDMRDIVISYPLESVPDLPGFRVKGDFAFSFTGTDFSGPLFVKNRK